jgi:hypothetical protein
VSQQEEEEEAGWYCSDSRGVSVSSIQDRGFEVSFRGTEVLIHPKGSSVTSGRVIGIREVNLYRLLFQPLHALASISSSQLCELWHQRMAVRKIGVLVSP